MHPGASRRVLADLTTQLSLGIEVLQDEPSDAGQLAVQRLRDAREALSLLVLERAAQATGHEPVAVEGPALESRTQLIADARAARAGRSFLRRTLGEWCVQEGAANAAVDVGSELVANAARETQSHVVLAARLRARTLLISVWDDAIGRPHLRPYRPGVSERGIGLRLVKHLSQEWGWYEDSHGKWVWARLDLPELR